MMASRTTDLSQLRQRLEAERARLLDEKNKVGFRAIRRNGEVLSAESQYDDHIAELGTDAFERERDLASADSVGSLLEEVEIALRKIEEGTYGVCDACGNPISATRLEALPYASLCLDCEKQAER
ncbi:MAG: TraR/DksA family transcriptional regulator [Abditibacteriales bacterium]|nr:TraR/DksA family transcriptional regulator [Abditibacteriales bacterium]MDW8365347.1 TraR/DksA C4-type zinc finger protein [Abditibacteriales bacterium]